MSNFEAPEGGISEEIRKTIDEAVQSGKIILLNVKDEDQRVDIPERVGFAVAGEWAAGVEPKYINCDELTKEEIIGELDKCLPPKPINFSAIFINNMKSDVYKDGDTIEVRLYNLRANFGQYPVFSHPVALIINFQNNRVPDRFRENLQGEYVEIPPPLPELKIEAEQQDEKEAVLPQDMPQEESKDKYIFRKEDEFYFIQYENENFKLNIIDGLKYMEHLLKDPYPKHFSPKQLYLEVNKILRLPDQNEKDTNAQAIGEGIVFVQQGDYFEEIVDGKTKKMIKELENEIDIAEATGNKSEADGLRFKLVDLKEEYVKKYLHRGKSRRFPSSIYKKQYDVINNSRTRVLKKIEKLSDDKGYDSMLTWKHLSNSINFEYSFFSYKPEKLPNWQF